jgi:hypothetical protein
MPRRVQREVGEAKGRTPIGESFIFYKREMIGSPALRVLTRAAILVMRRLEAEHLNHGGTKNGRLIVTRRQFEEWGVHRDAIGPAIRELVALGFVEVTYHGHAGAGGHGKANTYRLTYVASKHRVPPSDEWKAIKDLKEAEQIAKETRAEKDERTAAAGARGALATRQKKISATETVTEFSHGNRDRKPQISATETVASSVSHGNRGLYLYSRMGGGGSADG